MNRKSKLKTFISKLNLVLVFFMLIIIGACTAYYIEVLQLPQPETNRLFVQPCYFAIIFCAIVVLAKEIITAIRSAKRELTDSTVEEKSSKTSFKVLAIDFLKRHREVVLMSSTVIYLCVIQYLGFVITTFLFLNIVLYLVGAMDRKLWKIILVSAIVVAVIYLSFSVALQVNLVKGIFGF